MVKKDDCGVHEIESILGIIPATNSTINSVIVVWFVFVMVFGLVCFMLIFPCVSKIILLLVITIIYSLKKTGD